MRHPSFLKRSCYLVWIVKGTLKSFIFIEDLDIGELLFKQ